MLPGVQARLLKAQSDALLFDLVREGSDGAFEAIVHRYRKSLMRYCRRLSLSESGAEDVLHEALLEAWLALRGGARVREPKAWLYGVVRNTAVDAVRRAERERDFLRHHPIHVMPAGEADPEGPLVVRQLLAELAALPPLQREAIVRSAIRGASREQVASELGLSTGAVRGLVYRARAALRGAVTALTPPPLLAWLSGVGPGHERVSELGTSAGGTGVGAALLKGGAVAVATGTLIGAVVVHNQAPAHHHRPRVASAVASIASQPSAETPRQLATVGAPAPRPAIPRPTPVRRSWQSAGGSGGSRGSAPSGTGHARARKPAVVAPQAPTSSAPAPSAGQPPASPTSTGAASTAPTATTANSGSGAGTGTTGTESQGTSTGTTPPPSEPAGGSGEETKSPPPGSGSSGGSGSESGRSGGLVAEVLHTVGGLVGGLLNP
jgi:RNA polymerase sigma factor (sigma-70 family)